MRFFHLLNLLILVVIFTTFSEAAPRRMTEKEREIARKVINKNLINRLKQIYVISTRSRIGRSAEPEYSEEMKLPEDILYDTAYNPNIEQDQTELTDLDTDLTEESDSTEYSDTDFTEESDSSDIAEDVIRDLAEDLAVSKVQDLLDDLIL